MSNEGESICPLRDRINERCGYFPFGQVGVERAFETILTCDLRISGLEYLANYPNQVIVAANHLPSVGTWVNPAAFAFWATASRLTGKEFYMLTRYNLAAPHPEFLDPILNKIGKFIISQIPGIIPIDSGGSDVTAVMRQTVAIIKSGTSLLILPEGMALSFDPNSEYYRGAALLSIHSKAPIFPFYIQGALSWPPRQKAPILIAGGPPLYPHGCNRASLTIMLQDSINYLHSEHEQRFMQNPGEYPTFFSFLT